MERDVPDLHGFAPPVREEVDASGRLQHPWQVFFLTAILPVIVLAVRFCVRLGTNPFDQKLRFMFVFLGTFGLVTSAAYTFIGRRYSLRLAKRTVGTLCLIVIAAGLFWLIKLITEPTS
jgi:hypothetical protein